MIRTGQLPLAVLVHAHLRAHFLAVEKQLLANTEVSLDIATFRLLPAMLAGARLEDLDDRAAGPSATERLDA